jgi:protein arginine kinase
MRLTDLTRQAGEWLRGGGPMHDVVISSRIRLARNLAGAPFLPRCSDAQRAEIEQRARETILKAQLAPEVFYVDLAAAGSLDRQLLLERHLISRNHAEGDKPRGVAIAGDESMAIMVNEEDHLRIQVFRSGLRLLEAAEAIDKIDDELSGRLDFAFHSRYGYLTACPTNVGTGLRVSVMLHLPALKMTGEIEKAIRAARDMRLAIRGLHGEGTDPNGDFFQVSNQVTLGKSEEQIVTEFHDSILPEFIEYEQRARASLMARRRLALEDKIYRAEALLKSARIISTVETMFLLSLIRLGISLGIIKHIDLKDLNELFLLTQPAHLQRVLGKDMEPDDRGAARADFIRRRLTA